MSVEIGQLRFSSSNPQCLSNKIPVQVKYFTAKTGSDASSFNFDDVSIKLTNGTFETDTGYYMQLYIPRDTNYDMEFNIKLIRRQNDESIVYQFIKKVFVPKGEDNNNSYEVCLYTDQNKTLEITAARPKKLYSSPVNSMTAKEGILYKYNNLYYVGTAAGAYEQTTNVNALTMIASWESSKNKLYSAFDFTFNPVAAGFDTILIEMVRSSEDYGIQNQDFSYGRKLDIEALQSTFDSSISSIYKVNNLIGNFEKLPLSQIGVWGHPGLTMLINNEEIKIGPSGYYELDCLPINSLGMVAKDENDAWTIDYTYKTEN